MAFAKARNLFIIASVLISVFVGLRVYGAFRQERDDAIEHAKIAEKTSKERSDEAVQLLIHFEFFPYRFLCK